MQDPVAPFRGFPFATHRRLIHGPDRQSADIPANACIQIRERSVQGALKIPGCGPKLGCIGRGGWFGFLGVSVHSKMRGATFTADRLFGWTRCRGLPAI